MDGQKVPSPWSLSKFSGSDQTQYERMRAPGFGEVITPSLTGPDRGGEGGGRYRERERKDKTNTEMVGLSEVGWLSEADGWLSEGDGWLSEGDGWLSEGDGWLSEGDGWLSEDMEGKVREMMSWVVRWLSEADGWLSEGNGR